MLYLGVIKAGINLGEYCMGYGCLGVYDTLYGLNLSAFSEGRKVSWKIISRVVLLHVDQCLRPFIW